MEITTVGLDLAKNVFQLHAIDSSGSVVLRKRLRRPQVLTFFAELPGCIVGPEACGSATCIRRMPSFDNALRTSSCPRASRSRAATSRTPFPSRRKSSGRMESAESAGTAPGPGG